MKTAMAEPAETANRSVSTLRAAGERPCDYCRTPFLPKRRHQRFCRGPCRWHEYGRLHPRINLAPAPARHPAPTWVAAAARMLRERAAGVESEAR